MENNFTMAKLDKLVQKNISYVSSIKPKLKTTYITYMVQKLCERAFTVPLLQQQKLVNCL